MSDDLNPAIRAINLMGEAVDRERARAEAAEKRAEEAERERDAARATSVADRRAAAAGYADARAAESALSASRAEVARLTTERDEALSEQEVLAGQRGAAGDKVRELEVEVERLRTRLTLRRAHARVWRRAAFMINPFWSARHWRINRALREPETGGEG